MKRSRWSDGLEGFGGDASDYGAGRDVFIDNDSGGEDGSVAYGYAGEDGDVGAYPDFVADLHRLGDEVAALIGVGIMVEGSYHAVVAYEYVIAYDDAALILEAAAGVDEYAFAEDGVLAAVGIEWREHIE